MRMKLVRDVTREECPWLTRDFKAGEIIYRYFGITGKLDTLYPHKFIPCQLQKEQIDQEYFYLPKLAVRSESNKILPVNGRRKLLNDLKKKERLRYPDD